MKYLREGKVTFQQLGVDTINNQRELEKVYNYYIFSNPQFESYHNHIYKRSVTLSSLCSILIALAIGFFIGIAADVSTEIFYILYILFFFIVLGFIKITNDRMNDHEIYLIDKIDSTYKEEIFKWEDVPPNKK